VGNRFVEKSAAALAGAQVKSLQFAICISRLSLLNSLE